MKQGGNAIENQPRRPVTPAISYLRVSTTEQSLSGLGIEAQRATIAAACRARQWDLIAEYMDAGVSATARVRPGLDAAMRGCAARPGSVLVVSRLDRLARSLGAYARVVDQAAAGHWRLVALDSPDADTPAGEAMQGVVAVFAQMESKLIGQRTRDALAAARARGTVLGAPRRVTAAAVAAIVDRRRAGMTARAIAVDLNQAGIPAPNGAKWWPATVGRILRREGLVLRRGRPAKKRQTVRTRRARDMLTPRLGGRSPTEGGTNPHA